MKDGASMKVTRLQRISKAVASAFQANKNKGVIGVRYEDMSLWIQIEIGLSNRKAREYLDLVLRSHTTWTNENETIILGGEMGE